MPSYNDPREAVDVIEKYGVEKELDAVCTLLKSLSSEVSSKKLTNERACNVIVGNNTLAIDGGFTCAKELNYEPVILSKRLIGEAKLLGKAFAEMCKVLSRPLNHETLSSHILELFLDHGLDSSEAETFCSTLLNLKKENQPLKLCVIAGGETTVTLPLRHGLGGRNQEMVLSFALQLDQLCSQNEVNPHSASITFLSGGTDGQDGPTAAAGAVFNSDNLQLFDRKLANECLENHNSNFYFKTCGGLLTTGLTGTNVMDIQVLLIEMLPILSQSSDR